MGLTSSGSIRLSTDTQFLNQFTIAFEVVPAQVGQQPAAAAHDFEQATQRVVVFLMTLKCSVSSVIRAVMRAICASGDPVSLLVTAVFVQDLRFLFLSLCSLNDLLE